MGKEDEGQDFDALSEDSFDFGHFHELDSDLDEPAVEDEVLDPFTAAQKAELLEDDPDVDEQDLEARLNVNEEKFAFTQKLISNAQTLKQLRASGAPEIEIEYEYDDMPRSQQATMAIPTIRDQTPTSQTDARVNSQLSVSTNYSESGHTRANSSRAAPITSRNAPYKSYSQAGYRALKHSSDDELVRGKYHSFPAGLLKSYDFDTCKRILDQTKLYSLNSSMSTDQVCVHDLFMAGNLMSCPVLRIIGRQGSKVLLEDHHANKEPCKVIGVLPGSGSISDSATYLKLVSFHFDHVPTIRPPESTTTRSKNVSIVEEVDASFHLSSQSSKEDLFEDDPGSFPAAQDPAQHNAGRSVPKVAPFSSKNPEQARRNHQSILVILQHEEVDLETLRREWKLAADAREMYESEAQPVEVGTQATVGTDYSDAFVEHLDMQDFPVQDSVE